MAVCTQTRSRFGYCIIVKGMRGGERLGHWYGNEPVNYCSLIADFPCLLRPEHLDPAGMWVFVEQVSSWVLWLLLAHLGSAWKIPSPGWEMEKSRGFCSKNPELRQSRDARCSGELQADLSRYSLLSSCLRQSLCSPNTDWSVAQMSLTASSPSLPTPILLP